MKKLLFIVYLFSITVISCTMKMEAPKPITTDQINFNSDENVCVKVFYEENLSLSYPLNVIGAYHNEILNELMNEIVITDKCSENQYITVENQIDELILYNGDYSNLFSTNTNISSQDFYLNYLGICEADITVEDAMSSVLSDENLERFSFFSETEKQLFRDFRNIMWDGALIDIRPFVERISINRSEFVHDGFFSLAFLAIYENSSCFWSDHLQEVKSNTFVYRECWICPAPLNDALGAWYGGAKNLYETNATYDPNNPIEDAMARGAVSASIPIFGGDLYDWVTGG